MLLKLLSNFKICFENHCRKQLHDNDSIFRRDFFNKVEVADGSETMKVTLGNLII